MPDLSVVIPAWNERPNLEALLPEVAAALDRIGAAWEIIVVDGGSSDGTAETAARLGARVVQQTERGYGGAILTGLTVASSPWILTMDADQSHPPEAIERLWKARFDGDLILASRFTAGGSADMSRFRYLLSRILNFVFTSLLRVPVRDLSTGCRLYRREVLEGLSFRARDFNIVQEMAVAVHMRGGKLREIPLRYGPRGAGTSHARILAFGVRYLRTLAQLLIQRYLRR